MTLQLKLWQWGNWFKELPTWQLTQKGQLPNGHKRKTTWGGCEHGSWLSYKFVLSWKTAYLMETSCPTGSRLVEGWRRGLCLGNPSGTHSFAYTLLAPANTPTTNSGIPTHSMAMYSGESPSGLGGLEVVSGACSTEAKQTDDSSSVCSFYWTFVCTCKVHL